MAQKQTLSLVDGRTLDFYVSGPEGAMPLIWHHGTPDSGLQFDSVRNSVADRGLRLITMSRAGYGTSSRSAGRRVVDVAADTEALLDFLGATTCLMAGTSGGGPHALACASRMDAVLATAIIAGVAPFDAPGLDFLAGMGEENVVEFGHAVEGEQVLRTYLEEAREVMMSGGVEGLLQAMNSVLPDVDRALLSGDLAEEFVLSTNEALASGVDGWLDDDLAFCQPWGFALGEIKSPVTVWQGDVDLMVPYAHGVWQSQTIPNARARLLPGEGHLSIGVGKLEEIIDDLISSAQL